MQRKQMGEHLKGKLESMIHKQFENYLLILQTLQNDIGKLAALECELRVWHGTPSRVSISCNENGTFFVYRADAVCCTPDVVSQSQCPSATSSSRWQETGLIPPQECEQSSDIEPPDKDGESLHWWIKSVCEFGMSGDCNSLTALLHRGYNEWKRLLQGAFPIESTSESDKQFMEDSPEVFPQEGTKLVLGEHQVAPQVVSVGHSSLAEVLKAAHLASSCNDHEQTRDICSEGIMIARQRGGAASSTDATPCDDFVSILPQLLLLRISVLLRLRHYNSALQDAEELITCEPTCAEGYYWQAVALRGMRRSHESMESLMQALAYDPQNALYQQVFTSLFEEISTAHASQGRGRGRHSGDAQSATTQASHLSSRSTTPTEVSIPLTKSSSNDSL